MDPTGRSTAGRRSTGAFWRPCQLTFVPRRESATEIERRKPPFLEVLFRLVVDRSCSTYRVLSVIGRHKVRDSPSATSEERHQRPFVDVRDVERAPTELTTVQKVVPPAEISELARPLLHGPLYKAPAVWESCRRAGAEVCRSFLGIVRWRLALGNTPLDSALTSATASRMLTSWLVCPPSDNDRLEAIRTHADGTMRCRFDRP